MPNPRLAARYAKSLIDLAIEKGLLDQVNKDLEFLQALVSASPEFALVLRSPVIESYKKVAILEALVKGKISQITYAFSLLVIKKGRVDVFREILIAYKEQYNLIMGINKVKFTTPQPISAELKTAITKKLADEAGLTNIEMETKVDPNLIGGFVLEYNNNLVDASVLRDLKDIKKQFLTNDYIRKIR